MRISLLTLALGLYSFFWGQSPEVKVQPESRVVLSSEKKPFYYVENREVKWIDTVSLDNVEDFGMEDFVLNLGNHGSPEYFLVPELENFVWNDYSVLSYQPTHSFRRYNVFKPIVDAKYVVGTGQEQHFSLLHSQNIKRNINYSVGLNKINSQGIYNNQSTNFTDVFFDSYGEGLFKNRYNYSIQLNYLNSAASLNGGLVDDSSFINDTLDLSNRELLEINLPNAYQEINKWYGQFYHNVMLFRNVDSTGVGSELSLMNSIEYERNSRLFYDSILNTEFYDRVLNDSLITDESMALQKTSGFIGLGYSIKKKNKHYFKAGILTSYIDYNQTAVDTFRWDVEACAEAVLNFDVIVVPKFTYLINDTYAKNDYNLNVDLYYFYNKFEFKGKVYLSNERPQLDLLKYSSNHVSWQNSFEKYKMQHFMLGVDHSGKFDASLSINYFDIRNPIYFGYDKTPYQAPGVSQLIRTSVEVKMKKNKRWDLAGQVHYQYQGGYNVFRLPNALAKVSAAFKFKAFKKKMAAAIGADLTYFSKYESKSFDPVTGQYYIYSNGELGNYPYMNVFVKSRVQRATFFLMMSHPHQGVLGYNYFYAPGYPANDRFFRVGVSWLFVN